MSRENGKAIDEFLADVSNMKLTGNLREGAQRWLVDWMRITIVGANSPPRSRFFDTLVFRRS